MAWSLGRLIFLAPQDSNLRIGTPPPRDVTEVSKPSSAGSALRERLFTVSLPKNSFGLPSCGEIGRPGNYSLRGGFGWLGLYISDSVAGASEIYSASEFASALT